MKIINIEINDIINIKNIEDIDTGCVRNINSVLRIPTGNYKNVLLNFSFISPKIEDDMKIVASFGIDNKENIDVEITKVSINDKDYLTACYIPPEVFLNPCKVCFGVYGFSLNGDESLKQRFSLIPVAEIVVKGSYNPDSKESIVPSPTIFEIYFNKIDKATNDFNLWVSQKEKEINECIIEKISYLRKYENYVVTTEMVTSVPINLDVEYRELDIIQVKINGLDFIMNKNFTISNNTIHFFNPVEAGNTIYYSIERYITTNPSDYELFREVVDNLDGNSIDKAPSQRAVNEALKNTKSVVLWENDNPQKKFEGQTISFSTNEYNYFDVIYGASTGVTEIRTARFYKGYGGLLDSVIVKSDIIYYLERKFERINDTEYRISSGNLFADSTSAGTSDALIPIKIIGYR